METIKISDNEMSIARLELDAAAHFLRHRGQTTASVYVPGTEAKMTRERAYAAMLEEYPEAYAEYRKRHNAAATIRALEAAGIRLAR